MGNFGLKKNPGILATFQRERALLDRDCPFPPEFEEFLHCALEKAWSLHPGNVPEPSRAPGSGIRELGPALALPGLAQPGILREFYPVSLRNSRSASQSKPGRSGRF